jgi:hypothetical protein
VWCTTSAVNHRLLLNGSKKRIWNWGFGIRILVLTG